MHQRRDCISRAGRCINSAANWWLRTPNSGNANNVRNVNTDGSLNNNNANNGNGVAPDCV